MILALIHDRISVFGYGGNYKKIESKWKSLIPILRWLDFSRCGTCIICCRKANGNLCSCSPPFNFWRSPRFIWHRCIYSRTPDERIGVQSAGSGVEDIVRFFQNVYKDVYGASIMQSHWWWSYAKWREDFAYRTDINGWISLYRPGSFADSIDPVSFKHKRGNANPVSGWDGMKEAASATSSCKPGARETKINYQLIL